VFHSIEWLSVVVIHYILMQCTEHASRLVALFYYLEILISARNGFVSRLDNLGYREYPNSGSAFIYSVSNDAVTYPA